MTRSDKVELFEQLRREFQFGDGTIAGVARKFGVHRRMVRQAIANALPPDRKAPVRQAPQLAAVRAGFGIGFCQVPLAIREPVLTRVLPSVSLPLECWVVMHGDLRGQPACKALFDALVEGLLSYLA